MISKKFLFFLMMIFISVNSFSQADKIQALKGDKKEAEPKAEDSVIKSIAILPFYNYTDSGMKYVSSYIPELISNSLDIDSSIKVLGPVELRDSIDKLKLTPDKLYQKE